MLRFLVLVMLILRTSPLRSPHFFRSRLLYSSSSSPSTTTTSSSLEPETLLPILWSTGNWYEQVYNFESVADGGGGAKLVPVPEHLIPSALIEWGQQPNHLESLSSSTYVPSPLPTLRSETLTVYPETGCAADNLSFSYKSSDVNLNDSLKFDTSLLGVISTSVSSPPSMKHPNNRVISLKTEFVDGRDKLTVEFNVIAKLKIIVGDIKFTSSKKVTNTALFPNAFLSDLKATGGLDAQTLSKIKGATTPTNNHYDVINVKKPTLLKHLNAPYTRSFATPSKTLTGSTPFNLIGVGKVAGVKYDDSLRLPGGIIIRLVDVSGKWGVEVVRLVVKEDDEEGGRFFEKTIVERNFGNGGEQLEDVKFWREEGREKN